MPPRNSRRNQQLTRKTPSKNFGSRTPRTDNFPRIFLCCLYFPGIFRTSDGWSVSAAVQGPDLPEANLFNMFSILYDLAHVAGRAPHDLHVQRMFPGWDLPYEADPAQALTTAGKRN